MNRRVITGLAITGPATSGFAAIGSVVTVPAAIVPATILVITSYPITPGSPPWRYEPIGRGRFVGSRLVRVHAGVP
jgi:hypothetical protein